MLWFLDQGVLPAWMVLIVIVRDFSVTALRLVAARSGRVIAADLSGKIKTVVTMLSMIVLFLPLRQWMITVCITAVTVTTLVSGVEYFFRNRDMLNFSK